MDFGVSINLRLNLGYATYQLGWVTLGKLSNISKPKFLLKYVVNNTLKNCCGD